MRVFNALPKIIARPNIFSLLSHLVIMHASSRELNSLQKKHTTASFPSAWYHHLLFFSVLLRMWFLDYVVEVLLGQGLSPQIKCKMPRSHCGCCYDLDCRGTLNYTGSKKCLLLLSHEVAYRLTVKNRRLPSVEWLLPIPMER